MAFVESLFKGSVVGYDRDSACKVDILSHATRLIAIIRKQKFCAWFPVMIVDLCIGQRVSSVVSLDDAKKYLEAIHMFKFDIQLRNPLVGPIILIKIGHRISQKSIEKLV